MEKFTCPGRTRATSIPDFFTLQGKCTYCGSISAEEFFRLIEGGNGVTASKKTKTFYFYCEKKFCLHHATPEEQQKLVDMYNAGKVNIISKLECT